jgi:hypothetical protein
MPADPKNEKRPEKDQTRKGGIHQPTRIHILPATALSRMAIRCGT